VTFRDLPAHATKLDEFARRFAARKLMSPDSRAR
jgi:hypothetical protein